MEQLLLVPRCFAEGVRRSISAFLDEARQEASP